MKSAFSILEAGPCLSVQDIGRFGFQHLGIAPSGALDAVAMRIANLLVGNTPDSAVLETLCFGFTIRVEEDHLLVALAGSDTTITVTKADGSHFRRHAVYESFLVSRGDIVSVGCPKTSSCLYAAFAGGIDVPVVLDSRSTYLRGKIGGYEGRALRGGDSLSCNPPQHSHSTELSYFGPSLVPISEIRVVLNSQSHMFSDQQLSSFFANEYMISKGDRMALRLSGMQLPGTISCTAISDAIPEGSIQIAGDGQPIVVLRERQTTGGYPKIASIISADIDAVGRLRPGDNVRFREVSLAEAQNARKEHSAMVCSLAKFLREDVRGSFYVNPEILSDCNLISGVWNPASYSLS